MADESRGSRWQMREQFQQFQLLKTHQDDADEAIVESGPGSSRPSGRRAVFIVSLHTNPLSANLSLLKIGRRDHEYAAT